MQNINLQSGSTLEAWVMAAGVCARVFLARGLFVNPDLLGALEKCCKKRDVTNVIFPFILISHSFHSRLLLYISPIKKKLF